jgi:hypothetical protein
MTPAVFNVDLVAGPGQIPEAIVGANAVSVPAFEPSRARTDERLKDEPMQFGLGPFVMGPEIDIDVAVPIRRKAQESPNGSAAARRAILAIDRSVGSHEVIAVAGNGPVFDFRTLAHRILGHGHSSP